MRITELFDNGQFVVTAEVGPPKGIDASHVVSEAKEYLSGITAVNVTDNQSSVMRMGSLPACVMLQNAGLTPILQLTCRDRNRIALQSELLGAAALGIENILCAHRCLVAASLFLIAAGCHWQNHTQHKQSSGKFQKMLFHNSPHNFSGFDEKSRFLSSVLW